MTDPEPAAELPREPPAAAPAVRPYDPERGLRGAMSATLVLEGLTVLLSIPVARNTGNGTSALGVIAIVLLALAMFAACAFVRRPYATPMIIGLQVLTILGWLISGPLGAIGIIYSLVWGVIFWMRTEFRRRQAAGTLPTAR